MRVLGNEHNYNTQVRVRFRLCTLFPSKCTLFTRSNLQARGPRKDCFATSRVENKWS